MAKTKITRIKADDHKQSDPEPDEPSITRDTIVVKDKKLEKTKQKEAKKAKKAAKKQGDEKKVFVLFRPFVAFGHYLRDSWRELRQVRWPNRKMTWKMVLAVAIYTTIFVVFIILVDLLLSLIFNNIFK